MPMIFTKQDQKELRALKRREKNGEEIDWDTVLSKRSDLGRERWKRFRF